VSVPSGLVEGYVLAEGNAPDIIATIPKVMLDAHPGWKARAQDLLRRYGAYYIEALERNRPTLSAQGLSRLAASGCLPDKLRWSRV